MPIGSLQGSIRTRHTLPSKQSCATRPRHISKTPSPCSIFQNKASSLCSVFFSLLLRSCFPKKLWNGLLSPFSFCHKSPSCAKLSNITPLANEPARENDRGCSAAISSPPRILHARPTRLQPCAAPRNQNHPLARAQRRSMAHRRNPSAQSSARIVTRRAAAPARPQHHLRLDRGRSQPAGHLPRGLALRRRHRQQGHWLLSGHGALHRGHLHGLRRRQQPAADGAQPVRLHVLRRAGVLFEPL